MREEIYETNRGEKKVIKMSIDAFHPLRFFVSQFTHWQVIFKKKKGLKGEN